MLRFEIPTTWEHLSSFVRRHFHSTANLDFESQSPKNFFSLHFLAMFSCCVEDTTPTGAVEISAWACYSGLVFLCVAPAGPWPVMYESCEDEWWDVVYYSGRIDGFMKPYSVKSQQPCKCERLRTKLKHTRGLGTIWARNHVQNASKFDMAMPQWALELDPYWGCIKFQNVPTQWYPETMSSRPQTPDVFNITME